MKISDENLGDRDLCSGCMTAKKEQWIREFQGVETSESFSREVRHKGFNV
jgi:hypothetical protein